MKKVRLGVIGIGNMGRDHAKYLAAGAVKGAELAAICDIRPEAMQGFEGVAQFADPKKLIQSGQIDAVLIATPHYDHTTLGILAMQQGLHLLVEKPISVTKQDALELCKAARKGLVFSSMFIFRTEPGYRKMKQMLERGALGRLQRLHWSLTNWLRSDAYYASSSWRATWKGEGGGILLNQAPHNLDMISWLMGQPTKVRAFCHFGKYHPIEVEDEVSAYMEFKGGATGTFVASTGEAPGSNRLEISGDLGSLVLENGTLTHVQLKESCSKFLRRTKGYFERPASVEKKVPLKGKSGMHRQVTQNFVNAILKGERLIAPASEGIASVELANAMLLSSWTDKSVTLPINAGLYQRALAKKIRQSRA
jgi:predicted dehydrogenase